MDHSEDPSVEQSSVNEWVEHKLASLRPPAEWQPNTDVGKALLMRGQRAGFFRTHTALLATAVAMAVSGLLAFPQSRVLAERCLDACVAQTNGLAKFVGIKVTVGALPVERKPAPTFMLPDADGRAVNLADLRGKVVIVNFWATWCGPCKVEIPWFIEFNERFHDRSFTVVGISMDEDGWKSVRPYLRQRGVSYPVVLGSEQLANAYGGVEALPSTFLVDKTGKIAFAHSGLVSKATYEGEIMRLIAEKEANK
jgi:cytochrome c biogenesis protein CcmG/thiol:disulfide interchange protein DsbE